MLLGATKLGWIVQFSVEIIPDVTYSGGGDSMERMEGSHLRSHMYLITESLFATTHSTPTVPGL